MALSCLMTHTTVIATRDGTLRALGRAARRPAVVCICMAQGLVMVAGAIVLRGTKRENAVLIATNPRVTGCSLVVSEAKASR